MKQKPAPFKWSVTPQGIVEHYDFQYWKRSDPPHPDDDSIILPFQKRA